jgi:hypothetical protein
VRPMGRPRPLGWLDLMAQLATVSQEGLVGSPQDRPVRTSRSESPTRPLHHYGRPPSRPSQKEILGLRLASRLAPVWPCSASRVFRAIPRRMSSTGCL